MAEFWMELQPVDSYQVKASGILSPNDRKILAFLYQPLMGAECLALYDTLTTEVEENRLWSESHSHTQLLNLLGISLSNLFQARLKLEGLGLLRSFVRTTGESRHYIYEIAAPLSPEQFFSDGLLNIYLYSKIGNAQYQRLRRFFSDEPREEIGFDEVTRSFQDVFETFNGSELPVSAPEIGEPVGRAASQGISLDDKSFDFSVMLQSLSPTMLSRQAINEEVRACILKLHAIYAITELDMVHYLYRSVQSDGSLDLDYLRKIVRDGYQLQNQRLPELKVRTEKPVVNKEQPHVSRPEDTADIEALQAYLDTITPYQLLVDISEGAVPAETDLKTVDEVMTQQNLPIPVMNVLIEYVLLRLDGKIAKNFMMTIAAHWKRKKIQTAKEAMELAWAEHEKYKKLQEEGTKAAPANNRKFNKTGRKEVLPDWFDKEEVAPAQQAMTTREKSTLDKQVAEMKKRLKEGR
ncbi:replication initiation and membrane attachment family protein [Listeria booriae]|uniref:replication initiation and membrane attachment family protein n=1 Tax=Listeria booriae TaxID=1552123 RepID=UPI0016248B1A|nr:replication initiation and membrane attachment family protein [Listeria booriae]MBC1974904.1 helicase DnaB [Listeria booriae]MBC1982942.1 helicase DnaB [Listeria booriae]MBC2032196.1 helicase DnaB [Listeria booriae]MBC2046389.1 helicase DnaB [Listeria booriae]